MTSPNIALTTHSASENQAIRTIVVNSVNERELSNGSFTPCNQQLDDLICGLFTAISLKVNLAACDMSITHVCPEVDLFKQQISVVSLNIHQLAFLRSLGIDEKRLMNTCDAQHTLGTRYLNWSSKQQDFVLVEGEYGVPFDKVKFHHCLDRLVYSSYDEFAIAAQMARQGRFVHPNNDPSSLLSSFSYGMNVDAYSFAKLLFQCAKAFKIETVNAHSLEVSMTQSGIDTINVCHNDDKQTHLKADFFIDCASMSSAFYQCFLAENMKLKRSPISQQIKVRLSAVTQSNDRLLNTIQPHAFGWSKALNTASKTIIECQFDDTVTLEQVLSELSQKGIKWQGCDDQIVERVEQTMLKQPWQQNCLFIGRKVCDIDPLAHHLLDILDEQLRLLFQVFPSRQVQRNLVNFYNRNIHQQCLSLLDMVICHYQLNQTQNSQCWLDNRQVNGSENLSHLKSLFEQTGIFPEFENQFVIESKWVNFLIGFGIRPKSTHPLSLNISHLEHKTMSFQKHLKTLLTQLPKYETYVATARD
jgi:tryptophan halogenase